MSGFLDRHGALQRGACRRGDSARIARDAGARARAQCRRGAALRLSAGRLRRHCRNQAALAGRGRAGRRRSTTGLARVAAYARGGAAAVSVLTEPSRFDGSLEHLQRGRRAARAARRAGDAQGLPGRSLPGARGARGRCRRCAGDPAHAVAPSARRTVGRGGRARPVRAAGGVRRARISRRGPLLAARTARAGAGRGQLPRPADACSGAGAVCRAGAGSYRDGWPAVAESGVATAADARADAQAGLSRWR